VGFVRVSSDDQAMNGISLDVQTATIAAYCAAMGAGAEVIPDAGSSAKGPQRPGIAKILEAVRAHTIPRVVVLKFDRIARSTADFAYAVEPGSVALPLLIP
jgi:site-specific DNA recombinase